METIHVWHVEGELYRGEEDAGNAGHGGTAMHQLCLLEPLEQLRVGSQGQRVEPGSHRTPAISATLSETSVPPSQKLLEDEYRLLKA